MTRLYSSVTALIVSISGFAICSSLGTAQEAPTAQAKTSLTSGLTLERFDRSKRPQDHFYRFVNGQWLDTFKIPDDKSRYGVFDDLNERVRAQLKTIIMELGEAPSSAAPPRSPEAQKISDAYQAFMDVQRLEELGTKTITADLNAIQKIEDRDHLARHLGASWRVEVSGPIRGWIDQDAKAPTRYVLYLTQGGLGLPDRDYYLKDDPKFVRIREEYLVYLSGLFERAGVSHHILRAAETLALEMQLAQVQWTRTQSRQRDKTYNKFTRAQLAKQFKLNWAQFFEGMSSQHQAKITEVVVRQPSFFTSLGELVERAPLSAWRSYLSARLLIHYSPYLSAAWVDTHFKMFGTTLRGAKENRPRWKRGIGHVESILGEALGKVYVARHFKPEAKARMERLVAHLLLAFKDSIQGLEWMGETTKSAAQEKLKRFTVKIGYPDRWRDYSALEIKSDDLIGNLKRAAVFSLNRELDKLGKPIDRKEWFMPPQMVNAYYNPSMNEIVFPAAILQPPFFDMGADDAVNYGGIGAVIGHEISHGFDDQGRKSDGDGRLTDWWSAEDAKRFQKRADALSQHYERYEPLKDVKINGKLTLGENIGDLGGLTVAYRAYQISLQGQTAPVMDGFSGVQRFFISWAQVWACKYRDAELRRRLLTDPHSPAMYRVRGIVRQLPEFYQAFNVKEGDALFLPPEQRVKIW